MQNYTIMTLALILILHRTRTITSKPLKLGKRWYRVFWQMRPNNGTTSFKSYILKGFNQIDADQPPLLNSINILFYVEHLQWFIIYNLLLCPLDILVFSLHFICFAVLPILPLFTTFAIWIIKICSLECSHNEVFWHMWKINNAIWIANSPPFLIWDDHWLMIFCDMLIDSEFWTMCFLKEFAMFQIENILSAGTNNSHINDNFKFISLMCLGLSV